MYITKLMNSVFKFKVKKVYYLFFKSFCLLPPLPSTKISVDAYVPKFYFNQ